MNGFYSRFLNRRHSNAADIVAGTVRCLLLRSTGAYSFDPDHDFVADLFFNGGIEITVASYVRQALAGKSITLNDTTDRSIFTATSPIAFGALESGQTVAAYVFYEFITNDAASPLICHVDGKIKVVAAAPATASTSGVITGITAANPAVVTSTAHGLIAGQKVYIAGVGGMTTLNGRVFTVGTVAANTFQLSGEDSSGYSAYTSGGTWNLAQKIYVEPLKEAIADGTAISLASRTGTLAGAAAKTDRFIFVRSLSGAVVEGDAGVIQSTLGLPAVLGGGNFNINIPADGLWAMPGTAL